MCKLNNNLQKILTKEVICASFVVLGNADTERVCGMVIIEEVFKSYAAGNCEVV